MVVPIRVVKIPLSATENFSLLNPPQPEQILKRQPKVLLHQYQNENMNPQRLLNWATSIGISAKEFVKNRLDMEHYPVNVYKSVITILSKSKIYGNIELDLALGYALSINATSVKSIESILSKKLYMQSANNVTNPVMNKHKNIRGKDYYQ